MTAFADMRAAYEGVESVFAEDEVGTYRSSALEKTATQADFIARRMARGTVVEVACGNGRLLVALTARNAVAGGLGIDIAESRVAFARDWAADAGAETLAFESGDALQVAFGTGHSAAACITGAFGYFDAYAPDSGLRLLRKLHAALNPGGTLVLELYQHPDVVELVRTSGGVVRTWSELPPSDPWRFYLSEVSLEGDVMVHRKTFIHRTSGAIDTGRFERMRIYRPDEVRAMCAETGFGRVRLHEGWSDASYSGGPALVVVATAA